jgi:hypothetical protein
MDLNGWLVELEAGEKERKKEESREGFPFIVPFPDSKGSSFRALPFSL